MTTIRPATTEDQTALGTLAETAGLFPADLLPDMIAPALCGGPDLWLVADYDDRAAGLAFARPEEMTDRVWNLLALGVAPAVHGKGVGRALLNAVEDQLAKARMIVIETTQLPEQAGARALYETAGYTQEGRVRDFYADGEDKVIYRKRIGGCA